MKNTGQPSHGVEEALGDVAERVHPRNHIVAGVVDRGRDVVPSIPNGLAAARLYRMDMQEGGGRYWT